VKKAVAGQDNTTIVAVRVDEASDASDAVTTRVMRRPGEEQELRSRRIGITGRSKTSPPKRSAARSVRSAVWLVAAAIFFLIFAATVLLRALQPAPIPAPGSAAPPRPLPAAVTAPAPAPEPATADTPGPDGPKGPHSPAGEQPKSATPDAGPPVPVKPPAPQRARPQPPSPSAPPAAQPPGPSQSPGAQSGEVQEQRDVQPSKAKQQHDDREVPVRRVKRPERQAKENSREQPPKEALKSAIKSAPPVAKEGPTNVPRPAQSLPWGFGSE
jgi:hypothetical protein